jgi:hypothetical protein
MPLVLRLGWLGGASAVLLFFLPTWCFELPVLLCLLAMDP